MVLDRPNPLDGNKNVNYVRKYPKECIIGMRREETGGYEAKK